MVLPILAYIALEPVF